MGPGRVGRGLNPLSRRIGNDKIPKRSPGSSSLVEEANLARLRTDSWVHAGLPFVDRPHPPFSCFPQSLRTWLGSLSPCCLVSPRYCLLPSQLRHLSIGRRHQCPFPR